MSCVSQGRWPPRSRSAEYQAPISLPFLEIFFLGRVALCPAKSQGTKFIERHIRKIPGGLTPGAGFFVRSHGVRLEPVSLDDRRDRWLALGIPAEQVDRVVAFEQKWGGMVLPPSARYDGGPKYFAAQMPTETSGLGWWFEAGDQRTALPYRFGIGPDDAFGIHALGTRAPLHASVDGWVESLSLADHASSRAASITVLRGGEVDDLDLTGFEEVRAVQGVADRWWRGTDSLVAVYRGESQLFARASPVAYVYAGLDEWDLGTDLWAVPTGWHLEGSAQALVGWDVNGVLIERRRQGIYESWFGHPDGRRLGYLTNGVRVMLRLVDGDTEEHAVDEGAEGWSDSFVRLNGQSDRYANRDTVEFRIGVAALHRIIDTGAWPGSVRRGGNR